MARSSRLVASLAAIAATAAGLAHAFKPGPAGVRDLMARGHGGGGLTTRQDNGNQTGSPLECFEVRGPVLTPEGLMTGSQSLGESPISGVPACQVQLMDRHFANSYGRPFVADYVPPDDCPFNRVMLNFTVVSEGRQYDRLAIMYLTDTEVWRTSTAEPKPDPGIAWTYWKDATTFLSLWREPQTLVFDLGNVVDDTYTGLFNATLTATFFLEPDFAGPHAAPPDVILPVSTHRGVDGAASAFTYPETEASDSLTLPRNTRRAVFSVAATGQSDEEFWWSNVPQSEAYFFNASAGPLPALSSFREVRVLIDGEIAGLAWPFPVVFTGGISPPLHRPIVGTDAFDLREYEIDISPWLGVLCDGREHVFAIDVVGVDDTDRENPKFATVPMYWVLTGKVFIWLDEDADSVTTGKVPRSSLTDINFHAVTNSSVNSRLWYQQSINRTLVIESGVATQGGAGLSTWAQKFEMVNEGDVGSKAQAQQVSATYAGTHKALRDDGVYFATTYRYPIAANYLYRIPDGDYDLSLQANFSQGEQMAVTGASAYPSGIEPFLYDLPWRVAGTGTDTWRGGSAFYYQYDGGNKSAGYGSVDQGYSLGVLDYWQLYDPSWAQDKLLYMRNVSETNETITTDSTYVYRRTVPDRPAPQEVKLWPEEGGGGYAPARPAAGKGGLGIFSGEDAASNAEDDCDCDSVDDGPRKTVRSVERPQNRLLGDW